MRSGLVSFQNRTKTLETINLVMTASSELRLLFFSLGFTPVPENQNNNEVECTDRRLYFKAHERLKH